MLISIINPIQATYIFSALLVAALIISVRKTKKDSLFPTEVSQELKGLAILAIVFSHIGYFLVTDPQFLFPLSILAGVGVNLFLFLSGYGLTMSSLKKPLTILQFYSKRLVKLFIPLWIVLILFFLLDFFFLKINYSQIFIIHSFLGYYPQADIFHDLNSPLWYFSLILFYYLVFPLIFFKKYPWLSALILYFFTYFVIQSEPQFLYGVFGLYKVHLMAFPLGILVANLFSKPALLRNIVDRSYGRLKTLKPFVYYSVVLGLLALIAYTAYYSGVGKDAWTEEITSLITMSSIILLFLIKKIEIKLLSIFGILSYEIYLLHWPILYRYDIFFKFLPAWLALSLYLIFFLGLAWLLQKISSLKIKSPV